jgi:hypothetical protein
MTSATVDLMIAGTSPAGSGCSRRRPSSQCAPDLPCYSRRNDRENDHAEFIELPAPDRLRGRQLVPSLAGSCFLAPLDDVGP